MEDGETGDGLSSANKLRASTNNIQYMDGRRNFQVANRSLNKKPSQGIFSNFSNNVQLMGQPDSSLRKELFVTDEDESKFNTRYGTADFEPQ
jgi:hypothetical protein